MHKCFRRVNLKSEAKFIKRERDLRYFRGKPVYTIWGGTNFKMHSPSNKKIATVNAKGVAKAKKKGTVTITVRTANGKKEKNLWEN